MKLTDSLNEEIELKGLVFDAFERVDKISEIILLGELGAIRRILVSEVEE